MRLGSVQLFETKYIGGKADPLLVRRILFSVPFFGIYLHKFCRSDYDRALHDHPWSFISIILKNGYDEETDIGLLHHRPGAVLLRPAEWRHRVIINDPSKPSWNLILKGPRVRRWGFWTEKGWCWWRKYNYDTAVCEDDVLYTDYQD